MTEPKTPEEWEEWIWDNSTGAHDSDESSWAVKGIRLAMDQSRRQAIEECLYILRCDRNCTDYDHIKIRKLLGDK